MKKNFLTVLVAVLSFLVLAVPAHAQDGALRFAITSAVGSDPEFMNYRKVTGYITGKMGMKSVFISGLTYNQIDKLFSEGNIDVGFLCNSHFARRKKEVGFEPLVAPIVTGYNTAKFQIYIIVHKDSGIASLDDLRNRTVDFSDPLSTTTIYGADMLLKKNETLKTYFEKTIYSGSHDMTIELVANRLVDAGFIDGHIWDYHDKVRPRYSAETKIIHKSPDVTIPPVVVPRTMDEETKKKIKEILLTMHEDAQGKELLQAMRIDRFIEVSDKDYRDVLQLYNKVKESL